MKEEQKLEIAMRAKVGICWVQTPEEIRVENAITQVAGQLNYKTMVWTATRGLVEVGNEEATNAQTRDPSTALTTLAQMSGRITAVFLDLGSWLKDPMTLRTAKDVHRKLTTLEKQNAKQVIVVDASAPPEELIGVSLIEWKMPDRETMESVLDSFLEFVPDKAVKAVKENDNRNKVVSAMLGLTTEAGAGALSRSIAAKGVFDPKLISSEKERVVKGSGLEWYEPDPRGMDGIGGLDELKKCLMERRQGFTQKAKDYGLPAPKGMLVTGMPGGGKSLTSKCVAAAWGIPIIRMDVGSLYSKFVGDSEAKIQRALDTAEAIAPCILWIDEIEKCFSQGGGETDGGTSSRVFGKLLTWMQERKEGVFIIATSNDISGLPPEFLRAGRWDDIWFVDLPTLKERAQIAEVMMAKFNNCENVDPEAVADASDGNTGAEIEQAFIDAMFAAFADGERKVETKDVVDAFGKRVPLSKTMAEKLEEIRKWAKGRARLATAPETSSKKKGRAIE